MASDVSHSLNSHQLLGWTGFPFFWGIMLAIAQYTHTPTVCEGCAGWDSSIYSIFLLINIPLDPSYFVHVHEFTKLLSYKQLIHAWFSVTKNKAYAAQGCRVVGAHPSWHRLRGWVHPGQIAIPTDRQSTCTPTVSPANLTCVSLDYEKEPEHPEETHTGKGKHLCTRSLRCLHLSPRLLWSLVVSDR